jgi:hypothetical protein
MSSQAFAPLQQTQFTLADFQSEDGVRRLNQYLTNITRTLNQNLGTAGPVAMPSGIDVKGAAISNVGGIGPEHTAVSKAYAEANYSAAAIGPQLEGNGKYALRSLRRVNDQNQVENQSAWLEGMQSTSPTCNTATISGSGATATVSAGYHLKPSGNIVPFASRTDTYTLPGSQAILTLVRRSSVVTATLSAPLAITTGEVINIANTGDSSFDGAFVILTVSGAVYTWAQIATDSSSTGGTASEGSVYYYGLRRNSQTLSLFGPYSTDSQEQRLQINKDGSVLIAVASFTGTGLNLNQSAAGATPPPQNSGIHILTRL